MTGFTHRVTYEIAADSIQALRSKIVIYQTSNKTRSQTVARPQSGAARWFQCTPRCHVRAATWRVAEYTPFCVAQRSSVAIACKHDVIHKTGST